MDNEVTDAIILGLVQGLTEFLPVSSSGHLEIGKELLGLDLEGGQSLLLTVLLHAATALSTLVVFRKDVAAILAGLAKFTWNEDWAFTVKILVSMFPAAFVGIVFQERIETLFAGGGLLLVGLMLIATGLLLFLAGRATHNDKDVSYLDSVIVGVAQAIAILPGISRSGATISTCVLLKIDRASAARFSFLMVVPLILGKMAKDLLDGGFSATTTPPVALAAGFAAAFVSGCLACTWMISLVKNCKLWWFSAYCFVVGVGAIVWTMT